MEYITDCNRLRVHTEQVINERQNIHQFHYTDHPVRSEGTNQDDPRETAETLEPPQDPEQGEHLLEGALPGGGQVQGCVHRLHRGQRLIFDLFGIAYFWKEKLVNDGIDDRFGMVPKLANNSSGFGLKQQLSRHLKKE